MGRAFSFCQTIRRDRLASILAVALVAAHCGGPRRGSAPVPSPPPAPAPPTTAPASPEPPPPAVPNIPPAPKHPAPLPRADRIGPFEDRSYVTSAGQTLPYLLYQPPDLEPGRRYPLVLVLHSASGSKSDNGAHYEANRSMGLDYWTSPEVQEAHPSFVVAPLANPEAAPTWVRNWRPSPDPRPEQREPLELAVELIRDNLPRYLPIDADRLYVTGYSMGAFGAWIAISRHPSLFAAAVPISGGGDPTHVAETQAAVWAFHGAADAVVPASRSREMVQALEAAGKPVRYTQLPGDGHFIWRSALQTQGLTDWLFEQHRPSAGDRP